MEDTNENGAVQELSPQFLAVCAISSGLVKDQLIELFHDWVFQHRLPLTPDHSDEFSWFLSKKSQILINEWLASKRLAALEPRSPTGTGLIVISRERVDHVYDSRTNKDAVSPVGVVELLGQLFANGSPKYAENPTYPNQLLMFDPSYKAVDAAAQGEAPCAALQFDGSSGAHLRLVTAYWMKPKKTNSLNSRALKKGGLAGKK